VWREQTPLVMGIDELRKRLPVVAKLRDEQHITQCCILPLTTSVRRIGVIEFLSTKASVYSEEDTGFMQLVASQIAVSMDNAMHCESATAAQERLRALLDTTNIAVSARTLADLVSRIFSPIRQLSGGDCCSLIVRHEQTVRGKEREILRVEAANGVAGPLAGLIGRSWPLEVAPYSEVFSSSEPMVIRKTEIQQWAEKEPIFGIDNTNRKLAAVCSLPLSARGRVFGVLNVGHTDPSAFSEQVVKALHEITAQVSTSTDNTFAYQEILQLRDRLAREKCYLEEEIRSDHNFGEIIGESQALKSVLDQVSLVARLDSSVLILGETGTGKELIARAIHGLSNRNGRPLIKVNCAAIPAGLLESDLFGHEKGSFTGAIGQKIGRFELAHQGTLFLDEIGEIPLELQPKLLRALQEREIERVGGTHTIRIDARIITATNQDLETMIADRRFRRDLYYRLNVFPITIPPLRERPEDIPPLVRHFVQKFSKRMRREIDTIPDQCMEMLSRAPWPGNVRELENFIERAVILTQGDVLTLPGGVVPAENAPEQAQREKPDLLKEARARLEAEERDQILRALRGANWIVAGPRGAAKMLGMKRTTLHSMMRRLGISREDLACF
jgi:formate hydrogenlyase transcriptional activator